MSKIDMEKDKYDVYPDGNMWCAVVAEGFTNIQECPAGFGNTKEEAIADLESKLEQD